MKQITPETKARIFSCYWGCEYVNKHGIESTIGGHAFMSEVIEGKSHLLVKHLSSITDESAKVILQMHEPTYDFSNVTKRTKNNLHIYYESGRFGGTYDVYVKDLSIDQADYLRSKGYALPAFGYSVDELVEAGVFKIKEVNND